MYLTIDSKNNPAIKDIIKLVKDSSYRKECRLSVIYGEHLLIEALKHNLVSQVLVDEHSLSKYQGLIAQLDATVVVYMTSKLVTAKVNILTTATDIMAVVRLPDCGNLAKLYASDCVLFENIQDPGNLGTMLRIAAAAGINNVGLIGNCVDVYSPKVIRASQGLHFGLNVCQIVDFDEFKRNYIGQIIATQILADRLVYALDLRIATAFIFGNEGNGLSSQLLAAVNLKVKIPLAVGVDSLNVATACGVCVFEMVRQRLIG